MIHACKSCYREINDEVYSECPYCEHTAMNPNDKTYRGYLVRHNPLNGLIWIEKDGQLISYAADVTSARRLIDILTAGECDDD